MYSTASPSRLPLNVKYPITTPTPAGSLVMHMTLLRLLWNTPTPAGCLTMHMTPWQPFHHNRLALDEHDLVLAVNGWLSMNRTQWRPFRGTPTPVDCLAMQMTPLQPSHSIHMVLDE